MEGTRNYGRGIKLIFTGGHISLALAFRGLNVILDCINVTTP